MTVSFNHNSVRAKKARLARFLSSKATILLYKCIAFFFVVGGGLIMLSGRHIGALLTAPGLAVLLFLLWYYGELRSLPARLPTNPEELVLEQLLDASALARLKPQPTAKDIWDAIKDGFESRFFSVRFGLDSAYFVNQLDTSQISAKEVWIRAWEIASRHGYQDLSGGAITLALFLLTPSYQQALNTLHLEQADLEQGLDWLKHLDDTFTQLSKKEHYGGLGRDWAAGYTPTLNRLAFNISRDIERGGLWARNTTTHNQVVSQMLSVIGNSRSSSVALVGELGVGKTTAVYILAKKLLTEKVQNLRYHQIFSLDASTLVASAGNYQSLEQLLLQMFGEAAQAGNIILFLDEAELFMRSGTGSLDLTDVLLPVLQSGRLHLICAMTPKEWQLLVANKPALAGLLNYQAMPVPNQPESMQVMEDQLIDIEHKHKVMFTYQAVQEAYRLAEKYVHDMAFPGRGIRILEESAVFAKSGLITPEIVGQSMEAKLGVKVVQSTGAESQQLLNLEDELHKRLINQVRAVQVVANALRRARSGVSNPNRAVGTFLFLGPTGVGKTELAKALADVYYSGRDQIIRINLNEYSQSQDVERLLASSSGDSSGNSLLAQIRRQPYSVVLLDEIEKAHLEVLNVLLQLLDEGVLHDKEGREASFKDAIVIATSNAGADLIRTQIDAGHNLEEFEEQFTNQLIDSKAFTPEFLNRFDEIVLFRPLKPEELEQVVQLMIAEVNQNLARQRVKVTLSPAAVTWLVSKGNDPRLGARPMRRMVTRSVENLVAKKILEGSAQAGTEIILDAFDLEQGGVQS